MTKEYLSKEKYNELEEELKDLETVKRREVADKLEYARSLGDLSENAEYNDARNEQSEIESRINYLTELLKNAEIVKQHHSTKIEVGSTVTVQKKGSDEKNQYQVVGGEESDISLNKISYESPLGHAMLGKIKGEEFSFKTPAGTNVEYIIVDIA